MPTLAATAPHPARRLFFGLAVSILLHALLLMLLRAPAPSSAPDARRWSSLEVRVQLLPPPPVPIPEPPPPRAEPRKREPPTEVPRPAAQPRRERPEIKEPPRRKPPEAIYVPAPREPDAGAAQQSSVPDAPKFDPEAAKTAARNIASTLDPPKSDAPNAQVHRDGPRYKETKEQRLAREIKDSARPNCKDGIPGGLLAPVYLLMDKKDSGCKW